MSAPRLRAARASANRPILFALGLTRRTVRRAHAPPAVNSASRQRALRELRRGQVGRTAEPVGVREPMREDKRNRLFDGFKIAQRMRDAVQAHIAAAGTRRDAPLNPRECVSNPRPMIVVEMSLGRVHEA